MKKSPIIAAAIAATIAGSAFAADTTIYGNMRLEVINQTDLNMDSSKLVIGFKGSEDMGNGMTGFMHLELEHDDANEEVSGWTNDKSNVGIKGDFGSISLGRQGDAAGFACGGTDIFVKHSGEACATGAINGGLDNALVYTGGTGNVTFVLGATLDGTQDQAGDNTIIAAKYAADNFSVGFQMTSFDTIRGGETQSVIGGTYALNDITIGLTLADDGNDNGMAVAVSMPLAGGKFSIGIDTGDSVENARAQAAFDKSLDGTAVADATVAELTDAANAAIAAVDAGDGTSTHIQFTKNLSKSVYTGVEFNSIDGDDDDMIAAWIDRKSVV